MKTSIVKSSNIIRAHVFSTNSSVIYGLSDCNRKFVGKQTPLSLQSTIIPFVNNFHRSFRRLLLLKSKLNSANKNGSPQSPVGTSRRHTKDRPRLFYHHCSDNEPDFDGTLFDCCTVRTGMNLRATVLIVDGPWLLMLGD